uniref:NADH dehydrogenase subunit 6 n=1 Tax=Aspiculuris tetraptera TaxID=451377 RepID=A0A141HAU7_9BILA|nr:NADH dehydrogenase subunit 6 [Aspiculuris tetraptera]
MIVFCMVLSVLMCVFFYYSLDPLKCGFFLVLSLIFVVPGLSLGCHVWYSYFICLIFLSGVFVILVYFSSLSGYVFMKKPYWIVFFLFCFVVGKVYFDLLECSFFGLNEFYYSCYLGVVIFIVLCLVFFMNFVSYFLVLSGGMRGM